MEEGAAGADAQLKGKPCGAVLCGEGHLALPQCVSNSNIWFGQLSST